MKTVIKKTSNGIYSLSVDSMLLSERIIFLEGEINSETANDICKQILILASEDREKPVKLLISSPGGEINPGLSIVDALTTSDLSIYTYCIGKAYSMAAIVFACGKKRFMLENSEVMIHEPLISTRSFSASTSSVKNISDNMIVVKKKICRILADRCKKDSDAVEKDLENDLYMSAQEAVDYGIADAIAPFSDIIS